MLDDMLCHLCIKNPSIGCFHFLIATYSLHGLLFNHWSVEFAAREIALLGVIDLVFLNWNQVLCQVSCIVCLLKFLMMATRISYCVRLMTMLVIFLCKQHRIMVLESSALFLHHPNGNMFPLFLAH